MKHTFAERRHTLAETLLAPDDCSPAAMCASAERRRILRECQGRLTSQQAMLLKLRYELNLDFAEIGAMFQTTESAVWQMHQRVLQILLTQLALRRIHRLGHIL